MLHDMWEQSGQKPAALANKPELDFRWRFPYSIWDELSESRNYTAGGPAGIPFSEVFLFALGHGWSRVEMYDLWSDIRAIDKYWLTKVGEKQKEAAETAKSEKQAR